MKLRRNITLVLVMLALAGLLASSGSALAGSQWGDHPGQVDGAPWAKPTKEMGSDPNENPGPTNYDRDKGAPWAKDPKRMS